MTPEPSNWRTLAEQVSKEMDPTKLTELATQLNQALEREESRRDRRYREAA